MSAPRKLVLAVVDGMKPAMLQRAVATGQAPAMAAVIERGRFVDDCAAAFPSVTPTCAGTIATGRRRRAMPVRPISSMPATTQATSC